MKTDNVQPDVLQYSLTSTAWTGEIILTYNTMQLLVNLNINNAELSREQHKWFLRNMPRALDELIAFCDKSANITLTQIQQEVTFEDFWNRYDEKTRSSKKKAEARWQKLSKHDQVRAYRYINIYLQNLPSWQSRKIAETYLNSEIWNN